MYDEIRETYIVTYGEVEKALNKVYDKLSPLCRDEVLNANPHIFAGLLRKGQSEDIDIKLDKPISRECAWEFEDEMTRMFPGIRVDLFVPYSEDVAKELEEGGIFIDNPNSYIIYVEKRDENGKIYYFDVGYVTEESMNLMGKIKELKEKRYEVAGEKHKLWDELHSRGVPLEEWEKYEEPYNKRIEEISREIAKLCLEYCKPYRYDSSEFAGCMWHCDELIDVTWEKLVPNWREIVYD